jgi:virginiamycin B lyase
MSRLLAVILFALVVAGCGSSTLPSGSGPATSALSGSRPKVVQSGQVPRHWVMFSEPTANDTPYGITRGPDHDLWFTVQGNVGKIGTIDYSGTIHEFTIPGSSAPWDITAGHDGRLWWADHLDGDLGAITTTGTMTLYHLGANGIGANGGITAGPLGNVWFPAGNGMGEITPSGVVTYFTLPHPAFEVTEGPDGNIWYTDPNVNPTIVGKMTPTGTVTEYPLSGVHGGAVGIVAGPDGNLWTLIAGSNPGIIVRITTSGVITEYDTPTDVNGSTNRIVAGRDNNLWYTRNSAAQSDVQYVGQITTSGKITEYRYPASNSDDSYLGGLAIGADGNVWFVQTTGDDGIDAYVRLVLVATPGSVAFSGIDESQDVSITETDYSGTWTATTSNPGVATVAQGTIPNVFVISSTGAGSATITVVDSRHNSLAVAVSVP